MGTQGNLPDLVSFDKEQGIQKTSPVFSRQVGMDQGRKLLEALASTKSKSAIITPSQYPFPVFALCPPIYVDTAIVNNPWMKANKPIDKEKFLAQWYNFYNLLSSCSLVYLVSPMRGFQDQTYMNCAMYLPHVKPDTIILSNFTAQGRTGEEWIANGLFTELGYKTQQSPFKFEGEPELKYIRDNIYIGFYGIRTDQATHTWLKKTFDCDIKLVHVTDEKLYHGDCFAFPLGKKNLMLCTELITKSELAAIEKVVNIVPVSKTAAYMGICNSLKVADVIFNSSNLQYKNKSEKDYDEERKKNDELEKIARDMGFEIVYCDLSECEKSGAYLSCFCMHLNWRDD